jgi:hypothetical protein
MGFAVAYFTAANVTKLPVSLPFSLKKNSISYPITILKKTAFQTTLYLNHSQVFVKYLIRP